MTNKKQHVVIVGGGFGGVKAALELAKTGSANVTLISDTPHMRVYPSLYHTATGGSHKVSSIPLHEIFQNFDISIIQDTVQKLDRPTKTITSISGISYTYDKLILSLGVKTNYFGIDGLAEYSYGIKTLEEAEELKSHIHRQMIDEGAIDLNYIVVGGGPSGIELAGVLPDYIRRVADIHNIPARNVHVDLIEAAPRLLPRLPKVISRSVAKNLRKQGVKIYLKTAVQGQDADSLTINNKPIRSHTVIWTAGMSNSDFFKDNGFQLNRIGKVRVDQYLQAEQDIYVLGDNADTPYSGMAQTALYDGHFVAKNIERAVMNEETHTYRAKKPIYVMPAGPNGAAVLWGKTRIYGKLGWFLRRTADLAAYRDYQPLPLALERFMAEYEQEESCAVCLAKAARES